MTIIYFITLIAILRLGKARKNYETKHFNYADSVNIKILCTYFQNFFIK